MGNSEIILNLKSFFNLELGKRIIAVIIFVPLFMLSMYQGGILLFLLFIFFLAIISSELVNIYKLSNFKTNVFLYALVALYSIIMFPFYFYTLENNFIICTFIVLTIWIFDTFSYIGGNLFKGKKMFPKLSKGKTYSGTISGFISVTFINLFFYYILFNEISLNLFLLSFIICTLSFIGDACVSLLKRQSNLKDTGKIFIGHGGFLDRMDSFIMVFLFFIIFELNNFLKYV